MVESDRPSDRGGHLIAEREEVVAAGNHVETKSRFPSRIVADNI